MNLVNDDWFDRLPPRGQNHNPNKLFHQFCHKHDIQDAWRHNNNNTIQFSWFQPNALHRSRLDYWLVSDSILGQVSEVNMSAAPLTDHSIIYIKVRPQEHQTHCNGYWKFNSYFLTSQTIFTRGGPLSENKNSRNLINSQ